MAGFDPTAGNGQLTINNVDLNTPATKLMNLQIHWSRTARGLSITIPNSDGRLSRRRRTDERSFSFVLWVLGQVDMDGDVALDPYSQLDDTMAYLWVNVAAPPAADSGHESTITGRNGDTYDAGTAGVWVENWDVVPHFNHAAANIVTFDLVVPSGGWTLVEEEV